MKCTVKDINQCTKVLEIEVPGSQVLEGYDKFYKSVSRKAKIPGFRPGKAPRKVVEMHYSAEAREEVLKNVLSSSYYDALTEHDISPFGYPDFDDIDFTNEKLSYKATVEVKPDVPIKKYKSIKAKKEKLVVEDSEVDEIITRIRDGYAKYTPVEDRGVVLGDFAICDIVTKFEGEEPEEQKGQWCEIKENDAIAGFAEQTGGLKAGETKDISLTITDTFPNEKLRGKKAVFTVTVNEIKMRELPAIDEEFLKQVGDYKTESDFKNAVRKDIEARKKQDIDSALERSLMDAIEKEITFDLPSSLVAKRLDGLVQEAGHSLMQQGFPQDQIEEKKNELRTQYEDEAKRQVKVAFILDKIAELEDIKVSEEDIEKRFKQLSVQTRQPIDVIRDYYTKNNMLDSLEAELRNQNVIDFIKENAEIKE